MTIITTTMTASTTTTTNIGNSMTGKNHHGFFRRLPPPCNYSGQLSYSQQWKRTTRQLKAQHDNSNDTDETVFGLDFYNNDETNNKKDNRTTTTTWLAGCTRSGEICIWSVPTMSSFCNDDENDDEITDSSFQLLLLQHNVDYSTPIWRQKVSSGVLYQCKFVLASSKNTSTWLVVSGDEGVLLFDWNNDILPQIITKEEEEEETESSLDPERGGTNKRIKMTTTTTSKDKDNDVVLVKPFQQFQPFPSPLEQTPIEVNDFIITNNDNHLYGAAGDAFGCYKWNLETQQLVTTYRQKQQSQQSQQNNIPPGYLHSIQHVPSTNLVVMGGEDGILNIWDSSQDKLVDCLDMNGQDYSSSRSKSKNTSGDTNHHHHKKWISSCLARNEHWWTIAGGSSGPSSSSSSNNNNNNNNGSAGGSAGGYIATWHGPTRSLVSSVEIRETPHQLQQQQQQSSVQDGSSSVLLSVGNEGRVTHWNDSLNLSETNHQDDITTTTMTTTPNRQRIWCHTPSGYAIATTPHGQVAVGGIGSIVDVYQDWNQPSMKLRF